MQVVSCKLDDILIDSRSKRVERSEHQQQLLYFYLDDS